MRAIECVTEFVPLTSESLHSHCLCRFDGDKVLARDLLMLVCQTQSRNDAREANPEKKKAGEMIKRGRKKKPKNESNTQQSYRSSTSTKYRPCHTSAHNDYPSAVATDEDGDGDGSIGGGSSDDDALEIIPKVSYPLSTLTVR